MHEWCIHFPFTLWSEFISIQPFRPNCSKTDFFGCAVVRWIWAGDLFMLAALQFSIKLLPFIDIKSLKFQWANKSLYPQRKHTDIIQRIISSVKLYHIHPICLTSFMVSRLQTQFVWNYGVPSYSEIRAKFRCHSCLMMVLRDCALRALWYRKSTKTRGTVSKALTSY